MAKTIIKELIIVLLLCLAIILLLGIIFYEYIPMGKTLPNPVSYTTPESVKQELAETTGVNEEQVIMTYEVDENDLYNYKRVQDYKPGKANPFSSYESTETTTSEDNVTNGNTTTNTNNNTTTSTNTTTSGGQFFQDKGTK